MAIDQRVEKRAPAERCLKAWWRSVFVATSVMLLVLVPSVAHADTDDDVPGVPTSVGQTVTGVVDSTTDRYDVYSIALTEGGEVNIYITDSTPGLLSSSVYVELLPPGSLTIGSAHSLLRVGSDGIKSYMPAVSGTYYLEVGTSYHGMLYTVTLTGAGQPPSIPLFSDIASCPYRTAIEAMAQAGIISGYGNGLFGPGDPVKRAQFAKMAVLSLDVPVTEGGLPVPFWDVEKPTTNLYPDDYVAAAAGNGLILGYSDGAFHPYQDISRAQLLTIVVRMAERFKPEALITPPAGWKGTLPASDATHGANIAKAEYSGLLSGINLSVFSIWDQATRGEVAQILRNLREK